MALCSLRRGLAASLRPLPAHHVLTRAGGKFRVAQGMDRSNNATGPLHDLADFHFADGRPAPVTSKQLEWQRARLAEQVRIDTLGREMWELHERWAQKDEEAAQREAAEDAEAAQARALKEARRAEHEAARARKAAKKAAATTEAKAQ